MDGISNVWCVITPPDYNGDESLMVTTNLLWNDTHNRYEALYQAFCIPGTYVLTFQAIDSNGTVSTPMQAEVVLPDAYEPDNIPLEANAFVLGDTQIHNFHCSNDEDWIHFYAISNFIYEIETTQLGTNVDTVLDVYFEKADGTLTNIDHQDSAPVGLDEEEITWLDQPAPGMYYVQVSSGNSNAWGVSSEYELKITIPIGSGCLIVTAHNGLNRTQSPPDARAIVDGIWTKTFSNGETSVFFDSLPMNSSTHTVKVEVAEGYRMVNDPKNPNQMTNPYSIYGNPQIVSNVASFEFYPYVQVALGSVIRDRWTDELLSGAKITFRATSGKYSGKDFDGYPNFATNYKSYWYSRSDGMFPTNVWLYTLNYNLTLSNANYLDGVFTNVIVAPTPGQVVNLGILYLSPVDANTNGLADIWEERYFGVNRPARTNDSDGDGHNNYEEYLLGTDPTNRDSVLKIQISAKSTNGVTLTWPIANGHTYKIQTSSQLTSESWTQTLFGPCEAQYCQPQMQCTVTNAVDQKSRFYRIVAPVP
jgi:hypothetical protein